MFRKGAKVWGQYSQWKKKQEKAERMTESDQHTENRMRKMWLCVLEGYDRTIGDGRVHEMRIDEQNKKIGKFNLVPESQILLVLLLNLLSND